MHFVLLDALGKAVVESIQLNELEGVVDGKQVGKFRYLNVMPASNTNRQNTTTFILSNLDTTY